MSIVNTKTGRRVSNLWLILIVPVFLVGFFFYVVAALTCIVVVVAVLDSSPMLSAGPAPIGVDLAFIYDAALRPLAGRPRRVLVPVAGGHSRIHRGRDLGVGEGLALSGASPRQGFR